MPASPGTTDAAGIVRPLTTDKLAELVETAPSRRLMDRPRPRADYLEGLSRTYDVIAELARQRGPRFLTSWDELRRLCGTSEPAWLYTLQRYTAILEEVGLICVGPLWVGESWALVVRLGSGARPCSSTGEAAGILARIRRQMERYRARHGVDVCSFGRGQV